MCLSFFTQSSYCLRSHFIENIYFLTQTILMTVSPPSTSLHLPFHPDPPPFLSHQKTSRPVKDNHKINKTKQKLMHRNWIKQQTEGKWPKRKHKKQSLTCSCAHEPCKNTKVEAVLYKRPVGQKQRRKRYMYKIKVKVENNKIK